MRSRRFNRAAFVSLEEHGKAKAALFALGTQLVPNYVGQGGSDDAMGLQLIERVLTLERLEPGDALTLVGQVLAEHSGDDPLRRPADEDEAAIAELVDTVGCHARSLVLLAREVGRSGVRQATQHLHEMMAALHQRYPKYKQINSEGIMGGGGRYAPPPSTLLP